MVLTNSGAVKFSAIQTEFGGSGEIKMSEYYTGAGNITYANGTLDVPSSGSSLSVSQLRGRWKNTPPDRYPPAALSANTTNLTGNGYGNGTYICTTSYMYDSNYNQPYKAFDYNEGDWATGWSSVGRYNATTGNYTGTTTTSANGTSYNGEYIQIQFPLSLKLCQWTLVPRNDYLPYNITNRLPSTYYILGSSDGSSWNFVTSLTNITNSTTAPWIAYSLTQPYSYWRFVVNKVGNEGETNRIGADIAELRCLWTTT